MAEHPSDIILTTEWYNLLDDEGYTENQKLEIQNKSTGTVIIRVVNPQPDSDNKSGVALYSLSVPYQLGDVGSDGFGKWARMYNGTGKITVRAMN